MYDGPVAIRRIAPDLAGSSASPASAPTQLGNHKDAFERGLRVALAEFQPDGRLDEVIRTEAIVAARL
ncbi:hypothetical protein ABZZ80_04575 [Streptomyces sp. NPDC006356]